MSPLLSAGRKLLLVPLLALPLQAELSYFPAISDSFEYSDTATLLATWPQCGGSGIGLTTTVVHSGASALLAPETTATDFVAQNFFPDNQRNVDVTLYFYHNPAGYDATDMQVELYSAGAYGAGGAAAGTGQGGYMIISVDSTYNLKYLFHVPFGSSSWVVSNQLVATGWNKLKVSYDSSGAATIYLNDVSVATFSQAYGFSTLELGKDRSTAPGHNVVFDDVSVASTAALSTSDCNFEYGSMAALQGDWTVTTQTSGEPGPSLSTSTKRSYNQSVALPAGTTGILKRTFYTTNQASVDVSMWFYQDPANRAYVYFMPKATNGHYVMLQSDQAGNINYRLNSATWHATTSTVAPGWNEFKVSYDANGTATVKFNDLNLDTYSETGYGFASVEYGKTWSTAGNAYVDDFRCNPTFKTTYIDGFGIYSDLTALENVWSVTGNLDLDASFYRSPGKSLRSLAGGTGTASRLNDSQWNDLNTEARAMFYVDSGSAGTYLATNSVYGAQVALKADVNGAYVRIGNEAWQPVAGVNITPGWNEAKFRYAGGTPGVDLLMNGTRAATFQTPGYSFVGLGKDGTTGTAHFEDVVVGKAYQQTWVRGTIRGEDGSCPPVMVGFNITDASGTPAGTLDYNGNPVSTSGYSAILHINDVFEDRPINGGGMSVNDTYPCTRPDLYSKKVHCETKEFLVGPLNIPAGHTWNLFFEVYPQRKQADGSVTTDFTYYTGALWQHFQVTPGGRSQGHLTLGLAANAATISGTVTHNGQPWVGHHVRIWGNPDDSDTGFSASFDTDSNGHFACPVKGFYIDSAGARHEPCQYRVYVWDSTSQDYLLSTPSVSPGQSLNIGTYAVP